MRERTRYAILYARWSPRPDAERCESIQTQFEAMRHWCSAMGLEILAECYDEDASGSRADNRPGLQDAIYRACRNRAVLCVYSLSRLARNTADAIEISGRLSRCHADLASLHERIDTSTPMGRFFFVVLAALAALEREQTIERTSDAMLAHQARGRRMGRADKCPYGQMVDPDDNARLIECPEEQTVIQRILALHAEGNTGRGICATLDKEGMPRRGGKTWANAHRLVGIIVNRALYRRYRTP